MLRRLLPPLLAVAAAGCLDVSGTRSADAGGSPTDAGRDAGPPVPRHTAVVLSAETVVGEIDPRFLSVAVDAAQVVGGVFWDPSGRVEGGGGTARVPPYDFTRPRLRALAGHLAPAFLRIGGSEADRIYYDVSASPIAEAPEPFTEVMTAAQLDGIGDFATALGYDVMFTFNSGPGPRDASGAWVPDQARTVVEHVVAQGHPFELWELGNEPNGLLYITGFDIEANQLVADFAAMRAMVLDVDPDARIGGPSSAFWPEVGEINAVFPDFMDAGGGASLDVITWHYYPQQSRRCPVAVRRAEPTLTLEPASLDEVHTWAGHVESERDAHAPTAEVWLGESGHAQCGGEPGVSNRFAGSFWWLDQLGLLARRGHRVVVRQTLSGSDYGLIDDATLEPNPDYWASVLWRRLMGTRVLDVSVGDDPHLRAYAHCTKDVPGSATVLLLNVHLRNPVFVSGLDEATDLYHVTAEHLFAPRVNLNGAELTDDAGTLPALTPATITDASELALPPTSYAFVVIPDIPTCE